MSDRIRKWHILAIDDSGIELSVLSHILKEYEMALFSDPEEGLMAAQNSPPDLVLLDVNMPKISGFEVCQRLKENPQTASVPVVFLSGKDETQDIVRGLSMGAVDFITKPFVREELRARVRTQLLLAEMHRRLVRLHELEAVQKLMVRLNHEFNNQLAIMKSTFGGECGGCQSSGFGRLARSVERMQRVLERVNALNSIESEEYTEQVEMLKI